MTRFKVHVPEPFRLNYSLQHAGLPLFDRILVENANQNTEVDVEVTISVPGWTNVASGTIPEVPGRTSESIAAIKPILEQQRVSTLDERIDAVLSATVDGEEHSAAVEVLAYNEWSTLPEHAISLAAFAQPNNPAIRQINREIHDSRPSTQCIYSHLAKLRLRYSDEPCSFEHTSQKIRFHDEVLSLGGGTCIDLALLLCGLMESHGLDAAVLLVSESDTVYHAVVGEWLARVTHVRPVLDDLDGNRLLRWIDEGALSVFDPVAATASADRSVAGPFGLNDSREATIRLLRERKLIFGVDIPACRSRGVKPLPSASLPQQTGQVFEVLRLARFLALERDNDVVSTAHLFAAMLDLDGGVAQKTIALAAGARALGDLVAAIHSILSNQSRGGRNNPKESRNLRIVRLFARDIAQQAHEVHVTDGHLLAAFLAHPGKAGRAILDHLLDRFEVSAADLKAQLGKLTPIDFEWVESKSSA